MDQFHRRTGRQALEWDAVTERTRRGGEEGPENGPVDHFHRRTGRQALERGNTLVSDRIPAALPSGAGFSEGKHSLRLFRPGFAAPGKQASGLFSARTGRQALGKVRQANLRGGFRRGDVSPICTNFIKNNVEGSFGNNVCQDYVFLLEAD